jgi:hypothetical protein
MRLYIHNAESPVIIKTMQGVMKVALLIISFPIIFGEVVSRSASGKSHVFTF